MDYSTSVKSLSLQSDGKILVGGSFYGMGGYTVLNTARLNPDGSLDTSFYAPTDAPVECVVEQADGKILVGGGFSTLSDQPCAGLGRLNSDGTLDTAFGVSTSGTVSAIALQTDGDFVVGGAFSALAGQSCDNLGRLKADGSVDPNFNASANAPVWCLLIQPDGSIMVRGSFTYLGGQACNYIGRLYNSALASEHLSFTSSSATWLCDGTGPEAEAVVFDYSFDGANWTRLGAGSPMPGGWRLEHIIIPGGTMVRVDAFVQQGSSGDGSAYNTGEVVAGPAIINQPLSQALFPGVPAAFNVLALSSSTLSYQWFKDGTILTDGGNFSGTQSQTLALNSISHTDAGGYSSRCQRLHRFRYQPWLSGSPCWIPASPANLSARRRVSARPCCRASPQPARRRLATSGARTASPSPEPTLPHWNWLMRDFGTPVLTT